MFIKKGFPLFWANLCGFSFKSLQTVDLSANKTPEKLFLKKIKKDIKNAKFYADLKTVEKVVKKFTHKNLLTKMWWKNVL